MLVKSNHEIEEMMAETKRDQRMLEIVEKAARRKRRENEEAADAR